MAVAYGGVGGNFATSTTVTATISPTGADTVVVFLINMSGGASQTPSSVTIGGSAATSLGSIAVGGNTKLYAYYLALGTTAGSSVSCVANCASSTTIIVAAQWYTGAGTPTFNTPAGGSNPGNSASTGTFTATVASGSFTSWGVDQGSGLSPASTSAMTPTGDYMHNQDGSTSGNNAGFAHNSGSTSQTFACSFSGGDSWGVVAAEIPAVGGGGSGPVAYQLIRPQAIRRASGW